MSSLKQSLSRLKQFRAEIEGKDPLLAEESRSSNGVVRETNFGARTIDFEIEQESIVQRKNRPALRVQEDTANLVFADTVESEVWKQRLTQAKPLLDKAILAVGRIDLINSPNLAWVGTGWLIDDDILVTNRHVANLFVTEKAGQLQFMQTGSALVEPKVDFVREFESDRQNTFELLSPIYVVPEPGPDVALFRVAQSGSNGKLPVKIALADKPTATLSAAAIGYPAFDSRIPDAELMLKIYGNEFDKKRLAPGGVYHISSNELTHDCTTLGGNSGSVIVDMNRDHDGNPVAVGLHFAGSFLRANYAVPSDLLADVVRQVKNGGRPYAKSNAHTNRAAQVTSEQSNVPTNIVSSDNNISFTLPLNISVSLGQPSALSASVSNAPNPPTRSTVIGTGDMEEDEDIELVTEARAEDYKNRNGYEENFIGSGKLSVPLPVITDESDVLSFDYMGETTHELRYQNFSVVMKASRRLLYFSAANIDGSSMQLVKRPKWRLDPRIPKTAQIIQECYGRSPKFSRGHMTRKNDVGWGDQATRGVTDTMHATNAAPQMQSFNSPIWLQLEDYALDNAVADSMRISVFTGPYFSDDDPIYDGVKVPVSFWKIIAFLHDDTGELCATGYEIDQSQSLPTDQEFVFGAFASSHLNLATQLPISQIESRTGLDFGPLRDIDPLSKVSESLITKPRALFSRAQIKFT